MEFDPKSKRCSLSKDQLSFPTGNICCRLDLLYTYVYISYPANETLIFPADWHLQSLPNLWPLAHPPALPPSCPGVLIEALQCKSHCALCPITPAGNNNSFYGSCICKCSLETGGALLLEHLGHTLIWGQEKASEGDDCVFSHHSQFHMLLASVYPAFLYFCRLDQQQKV